MTGATDPAAHGGGRVGLFTVLFDEGCPICRTARRWLAGRAQLVPLRFVPAGSAEARERFPGLDHAATLRDPTRPSRIVTARSTPSRVISRDSERARWP